LLKHDRATEAGSEANFSDLLHTGKAIDPPNLVGSASSGRTAR
jgi:hypothetical protein